MKTSSFLLVAFLGLTLTISAADASRHIAFSHNVSVDTSNDDFQYRRTKMAAWSFLNSQGAWFSSISVGRTKNSLHGDAMWGAAYVNTGSVPVAWLAYWSDDVSFDQQTNFSSANATDSAGFMANAYLGLIEKNSSGTVVAKQSFKAGLIDPSKVQWDGDAQAREQAELSWVSFTGTSRSEPWNVTITFVISDVVGVIDYANATVSPKSLESIIEIYGWPYQDSGNTLSLVLAIATGESHASNSVLISGSDSSQVYFSLAEHAIVNHERKAVRLSAYEEANLDEYFEDANIKANLIGKYKSAGSAKLVTVEFPAGADHILYDPSLGAGTPVATNDNPSPSNGVFLISGLGFIIVTVLSLLF